MTYNIHSGTQISSHPVQGPIIEPIWAYGEYLQFATVGSGCVVVWQVSFTSGHVPKKVGSLVTPDNFSSQTLVLLPTHS